MNAAASRGTGGGYILTADVDQTLGGGGGYSIDTAAFVMADEVGDFAPPTIGQKRRRLHVDPQFVHSEVAAALTAGAQQQLPQPQPPPQHSHIDPLSSSSASVTPIDTPDFNGGGFDDADENGHTIKFAPFAPTAALYDEHRNELPPFKMTRKL